MKVAENFFLKRTSLATVVALANALVEESPVALRAPFISSTEVTEFDSFNRLNMGDFLAALQ